MCPRSCAGPVTHCTRSKESIRFRESLANGLVSNNYKPLEFWHDSRQEIRKVIPGVKLLKLTNTQQHSHTQEIQSTAREEITMNVFLALDLAFTRVIFVWSWASCQSGVLRPKASGVHPTTGRACFSDSFKSRCQMTRIHYPVKRYC